MKVSKFCVGEWINGWPAIEMQKTHDSIHSRDGEGCQGSTLLHSFCDPGIDAVWFAALSGLEEYLCLFV